MINYSLLAKNEIEKDNIELALIYYKFDLEIKKEKYLIYYNISILYYNLSNLDLSLKYCINSIRCNPNWYKSWIKLGYILNDLCKYEKALLALNRGVELSHMSDIVKSKINLINRKIDNLYDTDSESDNDNKNENNNIIQFKNKKVNINKFYKLFENEKIKKKLKDVNFYNKILNNKKNPFIIFQDKEIFNFMKEMYNQYKN